MKRQDLLDRIAHLVIQSECNSGLRFLLAALEFQAELDEEQFLEDQSNMRRRPKRLQRMDTLAFVRPVHLPQCLTRRQQVEPLANCGRNSFHHFGGEVLQRSPDGPAKPPRSELPLARRLINGDDSSDLQRLGSSLFGVAFRFTQNLELRLPEL